LNTSSVVKLNMRFPAFMPRFSPPKSYSSSDWTKKHRTPFFALRAHAFIARSHILNKNGAGTTSRLDP
jgi:hypothetical protein